MAQLIPAVGRPLFQLAQQLFGDGTQAVLGQRAEDDQLIQPPDQLRPEPLFRLFNGLCRLLFEHGLAARRKAQRRVLPRQKARAQIGRQQHDGVAEIRLAAHGIGELAILQNLQQDVLDVRVCLFDLVKQHDAVRTAADGLGQLPALIVAKIARRRTQQPGRGVLLLIFRHIELEQGFLTAEPAAGQRLGEGRLPHTGRPQKEQRPDGPPRLPQPGAAAPDGTGHRRHRFLLADDLRVEALFQTVESLPLLLPHPLGGDAAGLRHHAGDLLPRQFRVPDALPLGADAGGGTGLIHQIDGLIGQAPPRQIPHRKLHGLLQGLQWQTHIVVALVAGGQPFEDGHCLLRRRLFDLHPAKAAFQRGILLDVGAELLIRGRTDELQLPAGQHRFEDAGRVNGTFRRTGPDNGVELVHEQDGRAVPHQFFQQVLEPLFKVAAVFRARHKAGHIQCQQAAALQHPGHLAGCNALGQPFGQRRLAHARLPHQTGVVLLAAAQDLHHTVQFLFPAEHRVQLAIGGAAGQVAAVFVTGAAPARHGRGAGLAGQNELPRKLAALPHGIRQLDAHRCQQHPGGAVGILQHSAEQVFRLSAGLVGILRPDECIIHGPAEVRCQRAAVQMLHRAGAVLGQLPPDGQLGDVLSGQEPPCRAPVCLEHGEEKVAGICLFAAKAARQLHCLVQQQPRLPRKALVSAHAECFPNAHLPAPCRLI